MSYELTPEEQELYDEIKEIMENVKTQLKNYRIDADFQEKINQMGEKAHELHLSLKGHEHPPKHHAYMIENRGMKPDDENFYMHIHPVEDLIAFIDNPHANDDPEDKTIGEEFEFRVYSRRWGHEDTYDIVRTEKGWNVRHNLIDGPCDKSGQPFLFDALHQDFIEYPYGLDSWFEWLWDQAASRGLSKDEVQKALDDLAEWVSSTERNVPSGGVWSGYS